MAPQPTPVPVDGFPQPIAGGNAASPAAALPPGALGEPNAPELDFWRRPFVQQVLPFLTSLFLHLSLLVLGYLTFRAAREILAMNDEDTHPAIREQMTPVESDMSQFLDKPQLSLAGFMGPGNDPTRAAAQDKFPNVEPDSTGLAAKPGTNLIPQLGGDSGAAELSGIIGIGGAGGLRPGGGAMPGGLGEGDGSGKLAPFGPSGGGGVSFIGSRAVARQICFVCDASGSMMAMFDDLRAQISLSVGRLTPAQSFNVIFFQAEGCGAMDKALLLPAVPDNKRKADDFLGKVVARSTTNPIPALELAAKLKPEFIYLLTDGDFDNPSNEEVIKYCKDKFADGRTKINTLAFIASAVKDDPRDLGFVKTLQAIARNSGGEFKRVSEEDLAQR